MNLTERVELQDKARAGDDDAIRQWLLFCIRRGLQKIGVKKIDTEKFINSLKIEVVK